VSQWLHRVGRKTLFAELGNPGKTSYLESFNSKLSDELFNVEILDALLEAQVLVERWRTDYKIVRPHSALHYRPPVPDGMAVQAH